MTEYRILGSPKDAQDRAERTLVYALITKPDTADAVLPQLPEPSMFRSTVLREVYEVIFELYHSGDYCNVIEIAQKLDNRVNMAAILPECRASFAEGDGVVESAVRLLVDSFNDALANKAWVTATTFEDKVEASRKILELHARSARDPERKTLDDHVDDLLNRQQAIWEGTQAEGYRWGINSLDELMPMEPGKLYGLAGMKASGKTKTLIQVCDLALHDGAPVLFHSLEMPGRELVKRLLSRRTKIDSHLLLKRKTPEDLWKRVEDEANKLRDDPLTIDQRSMLTASEVVTSIADWKLRHDVKDGHGLVLIDFLQRVDHARRETDDNAGQRRTAYLVAGAAKDNNVAIVAALQTNKEFERTGKLVHTLVEGSGGYLQACDGCIMIDLPRLRQDKEPPASGLEKIIFKVSKNREGQSGRTIPCLADLRTGWFTEEERYRKEPPELKLAN